MKRVDAHEQYAELAVGYALYALEPEEEQVFRAHLAACAACERAVAEHAETLAHLAYAAEPADPPPALLEGIRAGVRASGREAAFPQPASLDQARQRRTRLQRPSVRRAATWVGAAAALVLIASLGVSNTALQRDRDEQAARYTSISQAVDSLRSEGGRTVPLAADGGRVVAVAIVHRDTMSLVIDGLAANDAAATSYVLWAKGRLGSVRPLATFDVARPGIDVLEDVPLSAAGDEVARLMVTHEVGNLAPSFSTRPVLAAGDVV